MNEQEKIEEYLSGIRHDLRSQLMVLREGASIILDNIVGSNCDNCFALLRPALESANELNRLIGEFLTTPRFIKILTPLISAKEEERRNIEKLLRGKDEEMKSIKEQLLGREEELRSVKRELLRKEEELKSVKRESSGKEEEMKSVREEPSGHELEILTYELMGMISHVIRTPLAVVKESLSLVLDEIPGELNAKQKELLSNGKKNMDNLIQSIEELSQESWDEIVYSARKHSSADPIARKDRLPHKKRILIVEDQAVISNMLKMRLEANNYEVITASDGQEGLDKVHKENPNLIILDVMLPKMNGYKVCQLLKADPKYNTIPIILSSGRTPQEIQKVGKEVGADAFVSKPFEAEELLSKMKELLQKKGK
jgi:twitching motility two-component system response regulator PilH